VAKSHRQQHLYGFLLATPELAVKKLLILFQNSGNIPLHFGFPVGILAFSYAQPTGRLSFDFVVNSFVLFACG
jgi:hypothetical protein